MPLCNEVKSFIAACERIHGFFAMGKTFTDDERDVLEIAAVEFLAELRSGNGKKYIDARMNALTRDTDG